MSTTFDGWRSIEMSRILGMDRIFEPWRHDAACRDLDPNLFFPVGETDAESRATIKAAKDVCETCPVRDECLDYALRWNEAYGIWGGHTEKERRRIRRRRLEGAA